MENCIHCQASINSEEVNFCPECEGQIRCLKSDCRKPLKSGKTICLICGTQVKIDSSKKIFNTLHIEESYSENSASLKIDVEATDNAIDKIAVAVANFRSPFANTQRKFPTSSNINLSRLSLNNATGSNLQAKTLDAEQAKSEVFDNLNNSSANTIYNLEQIDEILPELAQNYFKQDTDGSIIVLESLRSANYGSLETTKRSKARSLTLLYIFIYGSYKEDLPTRDEIYTLVTKEKMFDGNFREEFTKKYSKEYLTSSDQNKWCLDFNGKRQVSKIIEQLYNPIELEISSKRKTRGTGRPKGSSVKSNQNLQKWLETEENISSINTSMLKSTMDWALFAFYLLIKHLSVDDVISSADAYSYISTKYRALSIKKTAFQDVVSKTKDIFSRSHSGKYFLSPNGIIKAEAIFKIE